MRILVLADAYLPGYKAGGPIRSVANLVEHMPEGFEFWIHTGDRDLGDLQPYPNVRVDTWCQVERARVYYASPGSGASRRLVRVVRDVHPAVVYSNSLFSRTNIRYLFARRLGLVADVPLVIAPRGELSPGALALKGEKKRAFLSMARTMGLFREVVWQATEDLERTEVVEVLTAGQGAMAPDVLVAPNIVNLPRTPRSTSDKRPGAARFVFISRLSRKKNLAFGIRCLEKVRGDVTLDIYGPKEDAQYWGEIDAAIAGLPANVVARYAGPLRSEDVPSTFAQFDFFLFPTQGENFGHVIFEALASGCPVLLSDATPWSGLSEIGAGCNIALSDEDGWVEALRRCVAMGAEEHQSWVEGARRLAERRSNVSGAIGDHRRMFAHAAKGPA